jgi:hypothetical protein
MPYEVITERSTPDVPLPRRLTDKIFIAFNQACDQADYEVAAQLMSVLEVIVRRPAPKHDRRFRESLIAAYERLWHLRHPEGGPNVQ